MSGSGISTEVVSLFLTCFILAVTVIEATGGGDVCFESADVSVIFSFSFSFFIVQVLLCLWQPSCSRLSCLCSSFTSSLQ